MCTLKITLRTFIRQGIPATGVNPFKQIHDCVKFSELGGITIGEAQKLNTEYTNILTTGVFNSDFRRWDGKLEADKTWYNFKIHFGASYQQHRKIRRETAASSGYANDYVIKPGEDLNEAPKEFANLASATAADRGVVATLTEANVRLDKYL